MTTDLFSALDCNQIQLGFLLWMIPMTAILMMSSFYKSKDSLSILQQKVSGVHSDARDDMSPLSLMLFTLMLFLILMNLLGLAPYIYGITSSLWMAMSLAVVMWGLILISGWINSPSKSAAHLAPAGAPGALVPFLVLIETISILIRPLTLTVRLIANISAGHIVLALLANCLTSLSGLTLVSMLFLNIGYNMFEVFVSVIQAYIFSLLIKLYGGEHP
uniref:ATP synthase subunit a n=1 Tax=Sagaminopteron nigropunctatum TaxID=1874340 RepID=E6Y1D7_9GAST|nr:ATP synthase F0 subunit 6 [Sagaminopteron nigropunctatum]